MPGQVADVGVDAHENVAGGRGGELKDGIGELTLRETVDCDS
jgi:hypothetical protein